MLQDISRGGNFHETTPISFINAYGFYIPVGVIFAKKTRKLPPHENFHVYSICHHFQGCLGNLVMNPGQTFIARICSQAMMLNLAMAVFSSICLSVYLHVFGILVKFLCWSIVETQSFQTSLQAF